MDYSELKCHMQLVSDTIEDLYRNCCINAHACTCSTCQNKASLVQSQLAKATQEVRAALIHLDCGNIASRDILSSSVLNSSPQDSQAAALKNGLSSGQKVNSSHESVRLEQSDSLFSSTQRDSGHHTLLNSQSISPILHSAEASLEDSAASPVSSLPKPFTHPVNLQGGSRTRQQEAYRPAPIPNASSERPSLHGNQASPATPVTGHLNPLMTPVHPNAFFQNSPLLLGQPSTPMTQCPYFWQNPLLGSPVTPQQAWAPNMFLPFPFVPYFPSPNFFQDFDAFRRASETQACSFFPPYAFGAPQNSPFVNPGRLNSPVVGEAHPINLIPKNTASSISRNTASSCDTLHYASIEKMPDNKPIVLAAGSMIPAATSDTFGSLPVDDELMNDLPKMESNFAKLNLNKLDKKTDSLCENKDRHNERGQTDNSESSNEKIICSELPLRKLLSRSATSESDGVVPLDPEDLVWRPWEAKYNIMHLIALDHNDSFGDEIETTYLHGQSRLSDDPCSLNNSAREEDHDDKETDDLISGSPCSAEGRINASNDSNQDDADKVTFQILEDSSVISVTNHHRKSSNEENECLAPHKINKEDIAIYESKINKEKPLADKLSKSNISSPLTDLSGSPLLNKQKRAEKSSSPLPSYPSSVEKHISPTVIYPTKINNINNQILKPGSLSKDNKNKAEKSCYETTSYKKKVQQSCPPLINKDRDKASENISPQKSLSIESQINFLHTNNNSNNIALQQQNSALEKHDFLSKQAKFHSQENLEGMLTIRVSNKVFKVSKESPPISVKNVQWGAPAIKSQNKTQQNVALSTTLQCDTTASPCQNETFVCDEPECLTEEEEKPLVGDAPMVKKDRILAADKQLNQSLPTHYARKSVLLYLPANDSFEANQSYPKISKSTTTAYGSKGEMNVIATGVPEIQPRNRMSIFGMSPPDSCQEHSSKDRRCLESESESNSTGSKSDSENGFLKKIWQQLDATKEIGIAPSIQEVLFNCVTSSICVVNTSRGGKIVTLNESFQLLIGVHEKVIGQRFFRFIKVKDMLDNLGHSVPQSFMLEDGTLTQVSGKLLVCIDSRGVEIPVTVWTVPYSSQPRLTICVVEPTVGMTADIYLSQSGNTLLTSSVLDFLGYESGENLISKMTDVSRVDFSKLNIHQSTTVKTVIGGVLPVTVVLSDNIEENTIENPETEELMVPAQLSISLFKAGLIVVNSQGVIQNLDQHFYQMNLGFYKVNSLLGHNISEFLSNIIKISECAYLGPDDQKRDFISQNLLDAYKPTSDNAEDDIAEEQLCLPRSCFLNQDEEDGSDLSDDDSDQSSDHCSEEDLDILKEAPCQASTPYKPKNTTSRAACPDNYGSEMLPMDNGIYYSFFLHSDGQLKSPVTFKLSQLTTVDDETLYCLWFCVQAPVDTDEDNGECSDNGDSEDESNQSFVYEIEGLHYDEEDAEYSNEGDKIMPERRRLNLESSTNVAEASLGHMIAEQAGLNQSYNASLNYTHNAATDEDRLDLEAAIAGSFSKKFIVGEALGQGSFGFVRKARRIHSNAHYVVKFINKSKMFDDSWTCHATYRRVPTEVLILSEVSCQYIIKLIAVYENSNFVQMVMENFGEMDLFDFIDQMAIDEPLASHLFKQISKAVDYLHSNSILHRDIKDENVVVNTKFHCKLIDFGSACYMLPPGQKFTKFRGTLEYCSPEVHAHSGYLGPELDIWALGVTLFTIVFRENPFTADEGPYQLLPTDLPFPISEGLLTLMLGILQMDPDQRFCMQQILASQWLWQEVDMSEYSWEEMFDVKLDPVNISP